MPETSELDKLISSQQLASVAGVSQRRVQQLFPEAVKAGVAKRIGRLAVFHVDAVAWIEKRLNGGG